MADPFARLDPGAHGADVLMQQTTFGEGYGNEDLILARCYRDGGLLRRTDTDEFLRRIRGRDDGPLADLPPDVDPAAELVSPLYVGDVPVEFVRLSDPDDENVVTKAMALDVDVDKLELIGKLAAVFDSMTSDDPAEIESVLDQLLGLDDSDQAEQLLRKRLF